MIVFEKTYDPLLGITTTIGAEDGKMFVRREGDVAPSLQYTQDLRNNPEYSKRGIKKDWWHCVHIPQVVCGQMLTEDGFDVYRAHPTEIKKFLSKNRDKYSKLFVTEGRIA